MPKNKFQKAVFALITVLITVHAYVFYSLYVVNGEVLKSVNHADGVLEAIDRQGGVYMFGSYLPIWAVILIEFCFAFLLELTLGSPLSFKLACKAFDVRTTHPVLFESVVICSTVLVMCPSMSLIAAFLYYPYYAGFGVLRLLAFWLKLVCLNFPFAFFSQLFFIQPTVRRIFRLLFARGAGETSADPK